MTEVLLSGERAGPELQRLAWPRTVGGVTLRRGRLHRGYRRGETKWIAFDRDGSITAYGYAVITKNADGTSIVNEETDSGPLGTLLGTSLGSLIGLLGGPTGVAIGALAGSLAGATADLDNARIGADFVDEVSRQLTPGKFALVAAIDEDWTFAVDKRMEALGGVVYRRALSEARDTANTEAVTAMKADLAQMKAEHAQARAGRKPNCRKGSINSIQRFSSNCKRPRNGVKSPRLRPRPKSMCFRRRQHAPAKS